MLILDILCSDIIGTMQRIPLAVCTVYSVKVKRSEAVAMFF